MLPIDRELKLPLGHELRFRTSVVSARIVTLQDELRSRVLLNDFARARSVSDRKSVANSYGYIHVSL